MSIKLDKIAIIGGGIGGLITAIALHKEGYQVDVFENAEETVDFETGICLWPNASRILKDLGLLDQIISRGAIINETYIRDFTGDVLQNASVSNENSPAVCIQRNELYNILIKVLPAKSLYKEKCFLKYENINNEVIVHFENWPSLTYDLLIAADGPTSRVREQLVNDGKPIYRDYMIWRGTLDYTHQAIEENIVVEILGAGKRFGIIPLGNGQISWWATANETLKSHQHMGGRKKKLMGMFRKFYDPITSIINATPEEDITKTPVVDKLPIERWHDGKVVLTGDAAHPSTPDICQTYCLAVEDAAILAKLFATSANLESALVNFESLRAPRAKHVTEESLKHGLIGPVAESLGYTFSQFYASQAYAQKRPQETVGDF